MALEKFVFLDGFAYLTHYTRANTNYLVETPIGKLIYIYITSDVDICYQYSNNYGINWSGRQTIKAGTYNGGLSIWYDRWSGINADLIHILYDNGSADLKYINLNADTLAIGTEYGIVALTSAADGGTHSITRTRGGNLIVAGCIDAGAENFSYKSVDVGVNWTSIASPMESATQDQIILLPGWAADNQDAMAFFWDASANEIDRLLYDDSADSWGLANIATAMVDLVSTTAYPNFAATVDITNSQNLLVAWTAPDTANADLRCWKITEGAITEVTNVVLNSGDDQGLCAIGINTTNEYWYVFYAGVSAGWDTWNSNLKMYYKYSTNAGSTWSSETQLGVIWADRKCIRTIPRFKSNYALINHDSASLTYTAALNRAKATFQLGM